MATNKWYIGKATQAVKKGGASGLKAVADIIGDVAQSKAPVDTGLLETSMKVSVDKAALLAIISFDTGGLYAIRQHEDMSLSHPNGGQAKFLENPLNELGPSLLASVLAQEISAALG